MKTVLYVNHGITKACGVYDLGLRHFMSIREIENYNMIYAELNDIHSFFNICQEHKPDAIIFNYMNVTLPWANEEVNKYKCVKFCIPHLFSKNNLDMFRNDSIFDYYIILDKFSPENNCCFKTDRPLTAYHNNMSQKNAIPTIGSFGFALGHKFFDKIVSHINSCFDKAILNFHMPKAHFDGVNETGSVIRSCYAAINKPGIQLNVTTDFLSEYEVVDKLNKNDINCVFYEAEKDVGISSSLDYLVSAQKPVLITASNMFRSFAPELPIYPETTLTEIYNNFESYQEQITNTYKNSANNIKNQTKLILDRNI